MASSVYSHGLGTQGNAVMEFRRARTRDFPAILQLQDACFAGNLSAEEQRGGFLSAAFTPDQLEKIARDGVVVVASEGDAVAGFLCGSGLTSVPAFPIITRMLKELDRAGYRGRLIASYRVFIYGPVCIERSHRGRGLLWGLYEALIKEIIGKYDVGVGFVSERNPRSLEAHVYGLGMVEGGGFEFGGEQYKILVFDVLNRREAQPSLDTATKTDC